MRDRIICCFYPLIMIDYFLIMLNINVNSIIMLPLLFLVIYYTSGLVLRGVKSNSPVVELMIIWLAYNILSLFMYVAGGIPLECYVDRLKAVVFPMLFFFLGAYEVSTRKNFYNSFTISVFACFIIGLWLYFTTPSFYLEFLVRVREEASYIDNTLSENVILEYTRFGSFFSASYAISYFSIPAISLAIASLYNSDTYKKKLFWLFVVLISYISAILCQQRIAMVISSIIMLCFFISSINNRKMRGMTQILLVLVVIAVFGVITSNILSGERFALILQLLTGRMEEMSLSGAMSERTSQYTNVLAAWSNLILGDGIGSHSGPAMNYGYRVVCDGEFYRILVENGVVGMALFLIIIISSLIRMVKYYRRLWPELLIVLFFLLAAVGSNSLSINFIYSSIFWYSLGVVWNKSKDVSAFRADNIKERTMCYGQR